MVKSICTFIAIAGVALAAAPTASAHDRGHDYYPPRHQHVLVVRDRHMPHWLSHDRGFRHWYLRSSLRYDHHLAWGRLYEIYRWERFYRHDQHRRHDQDRGHSKRKWRYRDDD